MKKMNICFSSIFYLLIIFMFLFSGYTFGEVKEVFSEEIEELTSTMAIKNQAAEAKSLEDEAAAQEQEQQRKLKQVAFPIYEEAWALYKAKEYQLALEKFKKVQKLIPNYLNSEFYIVRINQELMGQQPKVKGLTAEQDSGFAIIPEVAAAAPSQASTETEIQKPAEAENKQKISQALPDDEEEKKISLNFSQANIEDVLQVIADGADLNIVVDPILTGKKIDFHVTDVTIEGALKLVYNSHGLDAAMVDNSLFVSTTEKIRQMALVHKVIKLKNINATSAENLIKNIPEDVISNKEINALIVTGTPSQISQVEKIIAEIDIPQLQVLLKTQVVEIASDSLKDLGINWSDSATLSFQETNHATLAPATEETAASKPFTFSRLARSPLQFSAVIQMLIQENKARVLSNPQITTLNEKTAEIFIGDSIPYEITSVTGGAASTEVRFVEAGIRLAITPSIIQDDFVVVEVKPEVSFIHTYRGADDQYPLVRTREASATVRIKNGEAFVLGGLLSDEDKTNVYRVPFVSRIPFIGKLFEYEHRTTDRKEIIITVVVEIIK